MGDGAHDMASRVRVPSRAVGTASAIEPSVSARLISEAICARTYASAFASRWSLANSFFPSCVKRSCNTPPRVPSRAMASSNG